MNKNDNQLGEKTTSHATHLQQLSSEKKQTEEEALKDVNIMDVNAMRGDHAMESQEDSRKVDPAIIEGRGKLVVAVGLLIVICWICWICSDIFSVDH